MVRKPCCSDLGLNKGPWTHDEDLILKNYVETHGEGRWSILPQKAGLQRCGRSCRLRWINYLRPEVKHDNISADEEELIIRLHKLLGNRWSLIASRMPGRTDNQIKNAWYSRLRKKIPKSAGTEDCNIQNPVLRPMPYRPSPNENLLIADRQMVHQQNLDNDNGAVVVSPTANDEQDGINQTGACSDIDEFIAKLPYWAFPQSNVEKNLTPFENFHNSFGNSYNINNIIDQGFCWSSSSTPPMPFSSISTSSSPFHGIGDAHMGCDIQNVMDVTRQIVVNSYEIQPPCNSALQEHTDGHCNQRFN